MCYARTTPIPSPTACVDGCYIESNPSSDQRSVRRCLIIHQKHLPYQVDQDRLGLSCLSYSTRPRQLTRVSCPCAIIKRSRARQDAGTETLRLVLISTLPRLVLQYWPLRWPLQQLLVAAGHSVTHWASISITSRQLYWRPSPAALSALSPPTRRFPPPPPLLPAERLAQEPNVVTAVLAAAIQTTPIPRAPPNPAFSLPSVAGLSYLYLFPSTSKLAKDSRQPTSTSTTSRLVCVPA